MTENELKKKLGEEYRHKTIRGRETESDSFDNNEDNKLRDKEETVFITDEELNNEVKKEFGRI